jgi:D-alanyl-D-alanine carboxypeptidase/D-alanyl-D-alanine-endopeptidase (penicillin-binding protein 4)
VLFRSRTSYIPKKQEIRFLFNSFFVSLFVFFLSSSLSVAQSKDYTEIQLAVNRIISESPVNNAVWSVSVRDSAGTEVISHNSRTLARMASNSKLLVSAALLDILGDDFTFETSLYADGLQIDSTWYGNWYFQGSGDPSIDGNFYNDNPLYVLDRFIDSMLELGITRIEGDLHGNESLFDDIRYPKGWEWDDLSYYYAPEISALSFNRNCVDLTVRATGRPGDRPRISWFPFNTDYVLFLNEQVITPANVRYNESYSRVLGTNTILLRSTLPTGYLELESLSITDPAYFFIDTFKKYVLQKGIEWEGELIVDNNPRNWRELQKIATHRSKPLKTLITRLNAESDNFYTEMLTKALVAYTLKVQGSTEAGLEIIKNWLVQTVGVPETEINFRDASGMASANLATSAVLTKVLHFMQNHDSLAEIYRQSLAQPGFKGTLQNRMLQFSGKDKMHAKTGFISGVRTLSGYIKTEAGDSYTFSFLTNNFTNRVRVVDLVHESILEELFGRL